MDFFPEKKGKPGAKRAAKPGATASGSPGQPGDADQDAELVTVVSAQLGHMEKGSAEPANPASGPRPPKLG